LHEFICRSVDIDPPLLFSFLICGVPSVYFEGDRDDLIGSGIRRSSKEFRREDIINLRVRGDLQVVIESR